MADDDDLAQRFAALRAESKDYEREAKRHSADAVRHDLATGADLTLEHRREHATEDLVDVVLARAGADLTLEQTDALLDAAYAVDADTLLRTTATGRTAVRATAVREHADRILAAEGLSGGESDEQQHDEPEPHRPRDRGQGRRGTRGTVGYSHTPRGSTDVGAARFRERRGLDEDG